MFADGGYIDGKEVCQCFLGHPEVLILVDDLDALFPGWGFVEDQFVGHGELICREEDIRGQNGFKFGCFGHFKFKNSVNGGRRAKEGNSSLSAVVPLVRDGGGTLETTEEALVMLDSYPSSSSLSSPHASCVFPPSLRLCVSCLRWSQREAAAAFPT